MLRSTIWRATCASAQHGRVLIVASGALTLVRPGVDACSHIVKLTSSNFPTIRRTIPTISSGSLDASHVQLSPTAESSSSHCRLNPLYRTPSFDAHQMTASVMPAHRCPAPGWHPIWSRRYLPSFGAAGCSGPTRSRRANQPTSSKAASNILAIDMYASIGSTGENAIDGSHSIV